MRFWLFVVIAFCAGYARADDAAVKACTDHCRRIHGGIGFNGSNPSAASSCIGRCYTLYGVGSGGPHIIGKAAATGTEVCLGFLDAAFGGGLEIVDNEPYLRDHSPENNGKVVYRGFKKVFSIGGDKGCQSKFDGGDWMKKQVTTYRDQLKSDDQLRDAVKASCNGVKESYVQTLLQVLDIRLPSTPQPKNKPGAV